MFSRELSGTRVFLVVAQRPFEAGIDFVNAFSLLKPVLHEDGRPVADEEFPDTGYVWWMLRTSTRGFAEPGRLLIATMEATVKAGERGSHWYQARVDGIEPVRSTHLVEIVTAPAAWAAEARDIVGRHSVLTLDHPPLDQVYVSWQGHLYGPLKALGERLGESGEWQVRFATVNPDLSVRKVPEQALLMLSPGAQHNIRATVSLVEQPPYKITTGAHKCSYRLILASAFERAVADTSGRVVLESNEDIIKREAKRFLNRPKRQELARLLDELQATMESSGDAGAISAAGLVKALNARLEGEERATEELASALLETGSLEQQLRQAIQQAEQKYIEQNAARLQTEIDEQVSEARKALASWVKKRDTLQQELEMQRREKLAAADKEAQQKLRETERACQEREEQLEAQQRELARQRNVISGNLAQVAQQLSERRDDLVNQFLAILPLLQQLQLFPLQGGSRDLPSAPMLTGQQAPLAIAKSYSLPPFVQGGKAGAPVTEAQFFERFRKHVEDSGFKYRRLDLAGFHLSVKCNDLTVLGGLPGTGKSSLPRLYAEALAGEEHQDHMGRYLHIGVSPSWLDMRDLLGHTNALDKCYQPAECGLYKFLINAQEEEIQRGLDSRIYLVNLDEMNLAHVEHYFSGFLQALELPDGLRYVQCFSPELVSSSDPFAAWPTLKLPRTLRFVGTVNFDETTRQLSQRVLDRTNLIRLRPQYLLDAKEPGQAQPVGPPVTLRQFRDWIAPTTGLDQSLGSLLDQLKEPVARLGCPLNPRRFLAIRKLLGNIPASICKPVEALDLQIAQRILPQARNLFRPGARKALDAIRKVLEAHPSGFPEALAFLEEIKAGEFGEDLLAEGGE